MLLVLATHIGGLKGTREALVISMVIATVGLLAFAFIYLASGTRAHPADVVGWLTDGKQALHSPPLLAKLRGLPVD